uniref:hypothetical protein n=1 Tax=Enterobacter hormaechei TaxID=158836 RepID=UPI00292DF25F
VIPGSSSSPAYARPWLALAFAAAGYAFTAWVVAGYAGLRSHWIWVPHWALAIIDLMVVLLPLLAAVILAGIYTSRGGFARATGIRHVQWTDLLAGVCVGLAARAFVELSSPTSGSLGGPFDAAWSTLAVTAIGAVVFGPLVEELFFRGLVL